MAGSICVANFEFATNEACKTPSKIPEIPCSLYGKDNKLRDLTPLIKLKGTVSILCIEDESNVKCIFVALVKGNVYVQAKWLIRPELIPVL